MTCKAKKTTVDIRSRLTEITQYLGPIFPVFLNEQILHRVIVSLLPQYALRRVWHNGPHHPAQTIFCVEHGFLRTIFKVQVKNWPDRKHICNKISHCTLSLLAGTRKHSRLDLIHNMFLFQFLKTWIDLCLQQDFRHFSFPPIFFTYIFLSVSFHYI